MLRRLRARRSAARRAATEKPETKPHGIFRFKKRDDPGVHHGSFPTIAPSKTFEAMSDDDDDISPASSSSSTLSFSFGKAELVSEGLVEAHAKALGRKDEEIKQMQLVLDELRQLHEDALFVKDEEILAAQIELGFVREQLVETEDVLLKTCKDLVIKDLMVLQRTQAIVDKSNCITRISLEMEGAKEQLDVVSASLMLCQATLHEREEELVSVRATVRKGTRTAQVVAGLLTLGALCTDDSRGSF
jgi:hypothetical protein